MRLPNQSGNVARDSLFSARGIRNERWRAVIPQQHTMFDIDEFFLRYLGCDPTCICDFGSVGCPCCFYVPFFSPARGLKSGIRDIR